ncbi:MAG: protein kinase [Planctomycetaceae bacterium]
MKVLVAEDSNTVRRLLEGRLKSWGYDPVPAVDGRQALSILNSEDAPRMALLDWQMPEMDGIEVCRRVKEDPLRDFTYVIILSSREADEDMVTGLSAGADDYLPKSTNSAILKAHLKAGVRILERIPPKEWSKPDIPGYTIEKLLGKGAFATVWKGVHNATQRPVALKILRMDLSTDGVFSRFAREVRLLERLKHPNIAESFDNRVDQKVGYCAMEYIDGTPLQQYLKDHKVNKAQMLEIVAQVCDGLEYAHQSGIIHRDVKPSNIMMTRDGQPKLVDFGLGRNLFREDETQDISQTMEGYIVGSPMYMAPEQARGENDSLDGRADLYAVGIILYLALVRRHPHDVNQSSRSATISEVARGGTHRPSEFKPNIAPDLERILMKSLAHDPAGRYQSARELADDLRRFRSLNC